MSEPAVRLPGIHFEGVPDTGPPALPRMDIAAFAGFAARGPVGVPVPLDDASAFDNVFGGDLALAWDFERGETVRALLRPAVREFFRNGGRRCWVVRLAAADAETSRFPLPGMLLLDGAGGLHPVTMQATSPGSWADEVSVHAGSLRAGIADALLDVLDAAPQDAGVRLHDVRAETRLLRLELPDGSFGFMPPDPANRPVRLPADVAPGPETHGSWRPARLSTWFRPALPGALPRRAGARLFRLDGSAPSELTIMSWSAADEAVFQVPASQAAGLRPGAWLRLDQVPLPGSQFEADTWLLVDDVDVANSRSILRARHGWRRLVRATAWTRATHVAPRATLLSVELRAHQRLAGAAAAELPLVQGAFARSADFPTDATRYAVAGAAEHNNGVVPAGRQTVSQFPLAWRDVPGEVALLPLGLERVLPDEYAQSAVLMAGTQLERGGLSDLAPALFLDPHLADVPVARLAGEAFDLEHGARTDARRPSAIHALMRVPETSLFAVPDAVHLPWVRLPGSADAPAAPPAAPVILSARQPDAERRVAMTWRAVAGATSYVAELADEPRFAGRSVRAAVGTSSALLAIPPGCRDRLYLRVRALGAGGPGAWSRTRLLSLPPGSYEPCGRTALAAPSLRPPEDAAARIRLVWSGAGDTFTLEQSAEPTFAEPAVVYRGGMRRAEVLRPAATTWFRVGAEQGDENSPWSNTSVYEPVRGDRWVVPAHRGSERAADREALESRVTVVHAAMLRMCAARGDMMCVLALPRTFREDDAVEHVSRLTALLGINGPEGGNAAAAPLSFGALYHPWLAVPDQAAAGSAVLVPPDGAMCGVMAVRASRHGAWAAPANRALADVVALSPALGEAARLRTLGRRVNLVTGEPAGFMVMGEATLSDVNDLAGIGVRRLLILLRRLAEREGGRYVFQPHSHAFRRLVHRQFDRLLGDLFTRGALAGRRPAEGYQVVTADSINPARSVDQGRLVVELRVAPSRPLHFLTVRLVQSGAGITMEEG